MKRTLPILFITISFTCFSQKNKTLFVGKIIDSSNIVKNAHIINLKTKKGTFSNDAGFFEILATEEDSLKISSIGFKTKIIKVKKHNFREKMNLLALEKEVYTLEEFTLKRHNLTGSLTSDINKIPKDRKADLVQKLISDIKNIDYSAYSKEIPSLDEMHLAKPNVVSLPNTFEGVGVRYVIGSSGEKGQTLLEKLEERQKIKSKFLTEFGEHFFYIDLKIPREKYHQFITYCSYKDIFKLYKNKETLKIIQIFKTESIQFLETLKKE